MCRRSSKSRFVWRVFSGCRTRWIRAEITAYCAARLTSSLTSRTNPSSPGLDTGAPRRKSSDATVSTRYSPYGASFASQWGLASNILRRFSRCVPRRRRLAARGFAVFSIADLTPHRDYIRHLRRHEIADVRTPRFEGGEPFLEILNPVVDGCNASDRAAHVVEHLVDNVRRNAQSRHAGGSRATKVVQDPMGNRGRLVAQLVPFGLEHRGIKALLTLREARHRPPIRAEHRAVSDARNRAQDLERSIRQAHHTRAVVLHLVSRQRPGFLIKAEFRRLHSPNFIAALRRKQEQLGERPEWPIDGFACSPEPA